MKDRNIPWNIISAYLNKEANEQQKTELRRWLAASPDNVVVFDEIINAWQISHEMPANYQPDEERLWNELMQRVEAPTRKTISLKPFLTAVTAAAAVVIIFLAGNWFGESASFNNEVYSTIVAPPGNKTQLVLPDGSTVILNSGAELKYSNAFSASNREVFMKGECFFDVKKSTKHQFTVNTSKLKVKVFGTQFNVNDKPSKDMISVGLISGKVQVVDKNDRELSMLKPHEQLVLTNNKFKVRKIEEVQVVTAWTQNILVFDNQSFEEVAEYLENWFGVRINLHKSLIPNNYFTFKIKTESLREVLDMISIITPIKYEINGDEVKIEPDR